MPFHLQLLPKSNHITGLSTCSSRQVYRLLSTALCKMPITELQISIIRFWSTLSLRGELKQPWSQCFHMRILAICKIDCSSYWYNEVRTYQASLRMLAE